MKKILFTIAIAAVSNLSYAQFSEFEDNAGSTFSLNSENSTLQIAGRISSYYEYRMLKDGQDNKSHNGWGIKDAELDLKGKTKSKWSYELQLSVIDLAAAAATHNTDDPTNPGIKAAYIAYKGFPVHIKFGYDKTPYSQGSLSDVYGTPMWSHANLYGGDFFSRHDYGLTLSGTIKDHIVLYGGAYSGMGENFFEYGNDASGTFEYIGRAEYCYPSRIKYQTIDEEGSPIPVFRIAVNARYMDKTQPAGHSILTDAPDAPGPYSVRIFDGKRTAYGGDFIIKYKGFSFLFETDMISMQPSGTADPLYEGTTANVNGGEINAGGFVTGLNYNWQQIKSVFSVQYETINANDLSSGEQNWLYLGYAYKVNSFNSVFKFEYYIPTKEDEAQNSLKYTGQLRVGYQVIF